MAMFLLCCLEPVPPLRKRPLILVIEPVRVWNPNGMVNVSPKTYPSPGDITSISVTKPVPPV